MFHRRKPVPPPIDIHDDASIESARLDIRGVSRRYGRTLALDDVSLSLSAGEILAVLGDSGCGKSTLLRLVAGLDAPDTGEIRIDGRSVAGRGGEEPPETRGVGLMFQDYALFPHLTVLANVRFGLRHLPGKQAREVARERLAEVGLAGREASYPATLSGGEAQRVALARALAPRPRLLLLDEPFSNLDAGTRERVRADTLAVLRQDGIGAILVTHDAAEAVEFADRIALMRKGRLVQCDTAEALYRAPVCPFAARALGDVVMVAGLVSGGRLTTPLGSVALPSPAPDGAVQACLRPEAIRIVPRGEGVPGRVLRRSFAGASSRIVVEVAGLDAPLRLTAGPDEITDDIVELGLVEGRVLVFRETEPA
ncbi:ABC transporter ATP-binding protein [Methylorubrum sp. B1-46]|uniref:ABC transporter ATP-binding protein n=1 Tax=Methylorubrum sp. B1-46 TaxID=2897334 RepID=UPI00351D1D24